MYGRVKTMQIRSNRTGPIDVPMKFSVTCFTNRQTFSFALSSASCGWMSSIIIVQIQNLVLLQIKVLAQDRCLLPNSYLHQRYHLSMQNINSFRRRNHHRKPMFANPLGKIFECVFLMEALVICFYTLSAVFQGFDFIISNQMQNNTTAYVKKLVRIVYDKEKQIESMRRCLKERENNSKEGQQLLDIHPAIREEIAFAATQLKDVNLQVLLLQQKMTDIANDLEQEIDKNQTLTQRCQQLELKLAAANQTISEQNETIFDLSEIVREASAKKEHLEEVFKEGQEKYTLLEETLKQQEEKWKLKVIKLETTISELKLDIIQKNTEAKHRGDSVAEKDRQLQKYRGQITLKVKTIQRLTETINVANQNYESVSNQCTLLKMEAETIQQNFALKERQFSVLSQILKDYEQFAFEISQHIQTAYIRHCSQGRLRSSKKLIREAENCHNRFESAFCKMNQIHLWMDDISEKFGKIMAQQQLPNETLEDLSIIAQSFEQKLELCDLTEKLEREKIQMDKNEEILLDNLQKQVEKSEMRDRSRQVELDQIKEVLKVTKDINRQLLSEINSKEFVISECRKLYSHLVGSRSDPEFRKLKTMLGIKP